MDFGEKDARKISIFAIIIVLIVLAYLIVRPFLFTVIAGLILSYVFFPVYKWTKKYVKNESLAASLVTVIILVIMFLVLWFTLPLILNQAFEAFFSIQKLNIQEIVQKILPTASKDIIDQITVSLQNIISTGFASGAGALKTFVTDLPKIFIDFFILGFIFFFALRDSEKLKTFVREISPLSESKEKIVVKNFKDMTGAIIYGWVIVGIIQGVIAGIGFYLFGVNNALLLTVLAILFSIIPFLGPYFLWIPVSIFILLNDSLTTFILFVAYNLILVSLIDNILRSYIIGRRTNISSAVILIGMLGGLFVFGLVGILVGPLILAYLLILLESFKDKSIYALFA